MALLEELDGQGNETLPGLIGIEVLKVEGGRLNSRLKLRGKLLGTATCTPPP